MKAVEEELNQVRTELQNSASQKARHSIWLKRFMDRGSEIEHEAFLALWLSRTVSKSVFPIALHLARGTRIALAPAVVASIYRELRPTPNPKKKGEPRFAQWHKIRTGVENVRTVLDSAKDSFHWHPYFGMDQDLPARVARWWKQSLSCLHGASDGALPKKRILISSELAPNRSKGRKKRGFNSFDGKPGKASEIKSSVSVSWSRLTSKRSKRTKKRNFTSRINTMPRKLDRTTELVCASSRPYISLAGKKNSLGTSKQKRSYAKASVALGSILKRAKALVQISNKEKEVSDAYASAESLPKKLPLDLIAMMEADNSPISPGFPPKFHLVPARDSTKKDNLANKDTLKSSKKQNDELEAWVSGLEKIVAELKAERFGPKRPVIASE
ncbi:hypothetical protein CUMW_193550, partial [Citrus unshiu]